MTEDRPPDGLPDRPDETLPVGARSDGTLPIGAPPVGASPVIPPPAAPEPPMSYAEKYRGTPWGRPEPPPPPPPPSRRPLAVAVVAVIVIVVAGIGIVALASSPSRPGPAPNGSPTSRVADASPSAFVPTPSPSVDPGKAVMARFWALVSAPDASYRMTIKGRTTFDRKTYESFSDTFTVVGDDYSGTVRSYGPGPLLMGVQPSQIRSASVARKHGIVYLKEAGKHRTARRSNDRYDRWTPFLYLQLEGWIDYVRPVTVGGRRLHLLRTNRFYRPDIARLLQVRRFDGVPDTMTLDVYVTEAGVPVSAIFTEHLVGTDQVGKRHVFDGRSEFEFARFGARLAVRIPSR